MRFKINEIGAEGLPLKVAVTADWVAAACPDIEARPAGKGLALVGRLEKMGDDYLLRANLRGEMETTCARCLERAVVRVDVPLAVTFVSTDADKTDDDEDPDVIAFTGNEIDVGEEVRDELLLTLPINPACKESCRGLCPVCGANLNLARCGCKAETVPAGAFAALGKVKLSNSR
ncbi:MAG TPA: DUF177 domain-containing protein [Polyangia bacterium]